MGRTDCQMGNNLEAGGEIGQVFDQDRFWTGEGSGSRGFEQMEAKEQASSCWRPGARTSTHGELRQINPQIGAPSSIMRSIRLMGTPRLPFGWLAASRFAQYERNDNPTPHPLLPACCWCVGLLVGFVVVLVVFFFGGRRGFLCLPARRPPGPPALGIFVGVHADPLS